MSLLRRPFVQASVFVAAFAALILFGAARPLARGAPLTTGEPRPGPFPREAAYDRLSSDALGWEGCLGPNAFGGAARVLVTFAPTGHAEEARVEGAPFAGTTTGECIAAKFRDLDVAPFAGPSQTLAIVVVKPAPDRRPAAPR